MHIAFIAMSGVRAANEELNRIGLTLPGFLERSKVIASLPSLSLLTLAGMTPDSFEVSYHEVADLRLLDELPPCDVAAIASFSAQIKDAYTLSDRYRALGVRTVLGGLHVTARPDEAAQHADAIVIGEGEIGWPELLEDLWRFSDRPVSLNLDIRRIAVLVSKVDTGGQGTRIPVVYLFSIGLGRSPETFTAALWNLQPNDTRLVSVLRHELGHELGLEDYYPLDDPCPPYPSAPDPWWNRACVAPWDPMGYAEFGTEFSGYSRLQLGWLDGGADWGDVLTLPALLGAAFTTRTWTLDLAPLEGTTAEIGAATTREKPRLLRIPVIPGREYDVECRRQVAFDRAWIHRSA